MKAAIFDMDGLLLDSEQYYGRGWIEAGRIHGVNITWEIIRDNCGREKEYSRTYMKGLFGQDFDYDGFRAESRRIVAQWLGDDPMPPKPHAREILQELKALGYRLGLATSTAREVAMTQLEKLDMARYFDATCCGGEAQRGKPFPDIFLLVAQRLGVLPADCAVLEDSANGILAGNAAGMTTLWIPDIITPELRPDILEKATVLLPNLAEASQYLQERFTA